MRIYILFIAVFFSSVHAGNIPLLEVRELYRNAADKKEACKKLLYISGKYSSDNNQTITAYNACATMMMANHVFNPLGKLSYFNEGRKLLEKCIKADNENIEIRFLRYAIQTKSPSFLGYNNSIEKDKFFLLKEIKNVKDGQLNHIIISFLKSSEGLTQIEKQNIKQ